MHKLLHDRHVLHFFLSGGFPLLFDAFDIAGKTFGIVISVNRFSQQFHIYAVAMITSDIFFPNQLSKAFPARFGRVMADVISPSLSFPFISWTVITSGTSF